VNISSPNTPEFRKYFQREFFKDSAASLYAAKRKPTYLKIHPSTSSDEMVLLTKIVGKTTIKSVEQRSSII
jgi:dihydroorotate dehydrogenase